jgi:Na+-translocating ferredoxin:NAD+ oxidoreductase subunit D
MKFEASPAPHTLKRGSVRRIMWLVLLMLLPAAIAQVVYFGPGFGVQAVIATVAALVAEAFMLKLRKQPLRAFLTDGSAVVTAVLLAFALPPLAPWWLAASGSLFAIVVAKHLFGGLGRNVFNPAMAGYAMLLVSFPAALTLWPGPHGAAAGMTQLGLEDTFTTIMTAAPPAASTWDAITTATPLDAVRTGLKTGHTMQEVRTGAVFSSMGGRGWEWIAVAALAGGVGLLALRIVRWQIPLSMLVTVTVFAGVLNALDPGANTGVLFHLTTGSTVLGAFFIACDPVTAATSERGRLWFGAGIGILTIAIRTWGHFPDGVAFAVLIMNLFVPLIDRLTVPRVYGHQR